MKIIYKTVEVNTPVETDYEKVANKPLINSVELTDDKTTEDLKITWYGKQYDYDHLTEFNPSTMYIVDTYSSEGIDNDYLDFSHRPKINGVDLEYNEISSDFGLSTRDAVDNEIATMRSVKVVTELPTAPLPNTMYYVGPDSEDLYYVYVFDSSLTKIDLGPSTQRVYTVSEGIEITSSKVINVQVDDKTIDTNSSNQLEVLKSGILDIVHPVGSIYMSLTLSTPQQVANKLGGTWVAWGAGKIPVGVNTNDSDFNTVEKTGGLKTQSATSSAATGNTGDTTLTVAQTPKHNHVAFVFNGNANGGDAYYMNDDGVNRTKAANGYKYYGYDDGGYSPSVTNVWDWCSGTFTTAAGGAGGTAMGDRMGNTNTIGSGGSHNHSLGDHTHEASVNTVMYGVTCYMYKRTA